MVVGHRVVLICFLAVVMLALISAFIVCDRKDEFASYTGTFTPAEAFDF